jgi:hypothetical protein
MNQGALMFAINTQGVDYVKIAAWNAGNIRRHLEIPVALITDDPGCYADCFDEIITVARRDDSGRRNFEGIGSVAWHNTNRVDAYGLSPWQHTLLLDADYIVASPDLKKLLSCDQEFMCFRSAYDITGHHDFVDMDSFGDFRMPMWWATVISFRRGHKARIIFDCMHMVRENWTHYRRVYGNRPYLYRNDHALSIALNIENGHTLCTTDIPWKLATVMPSCKITNTGMDAYRIDWVDAQKRNRYLDIKAQDLHVMAKKSLEDMIDTIS